MPRSKSRRHEDDIMVSAVTEYRVQDSDLYTLQANAAIDLKMIDDIGTELITRLEGNKTLQDMIAVSLTRVHYLAIALQRMDVMYTAARAGTEEAISQRNEVLKELHDFQTAVREGRIDEPAFQDVCRTIQERARQMAFNDAWISIIADSADAIHSRMNKLGYELDYGLIVTFVNRLYSPDEGVSESFIYHVWEAIHAPAPEAAAV